MNNQELELKIKEILEEKNFFDMILKAKEFEKEYKNSDFFKSTKMSLNDVIKGAKAWYAINLDDAFEKIQEKINGLDLSHLNGLLDEMSQVFSQENADINSLLDSLKDFKM